MELQKSIKVIEKYQMNEEAEEEKKEIIDSQ